MADNGDHIRFDARGGRVVGKVPSGRVLIDGTRTGEIGDEVLRDRRHLAYGGLVVPVIGINRQTGAVEGVPDVITRGFVLDERSEPLMRDAGVIVTEIIEAASVEERTDVGLIQEKVRVDLQRVFRRAIRPPAARRCPSSWRSDRVPQRALAPRCAKSWASPSSGWRCSGSSRWPATRPTDPALFFSTPAIGAPGELRRPRRRVPARAVVPGVRLRRLSAAGRPRRDRLALLLGAARCDAPLTKPIGAALLFASSSGCSASRSIASRIGGKLVPAGGVIGAFVADRLTDQFAPHRRAHPAAVAPVPRGAHGDAALARRGGLGDRRRGSGRSPRRASPRVKHWREERRREQQRQEVIRKHVEKGTAPGDRRRRRVKQAGARAGVTPRSRRVASAGRPSRPTKIDDAPAPPPVDAVGGRRAARRRACAITRAVAAAARSRAAQGAGRAPQGRIRAAAAGAARRDQGRAQDRRARADGRARASSKTSAASSRSRATSSRSTRARSSRPTSSSPTPA